MPRREQMINKLRELGYSYSRTCDRTHLWRKGTNRVFLPTHAQIKDEAARSILRQCGQTDAEVEAFMRLCKA